MNLPDGKLGLFGHMGHLYYFNKGEFKKTVNCLDKNGLGRYIRYACIKYPQNFLDKEFIDILRKNKFYSVCMSKSFTICSKLREDPSYLKDLTLNLYKDLKFYLRGGVNFKIGDHLVLLMHRTLPCNFLAYMLDKEGVSSIIRKLYKTNIRSILTLVRCAKLLTGVDTPILCVELIVEEILKLYIQAERPLDLVASWV